MKEFIPVSEKKNGSQPASISDARRDTLNGFSASPNNSFFFRAVTTCAERPPDEGVAS